MKEYEGKRNQPPASKKSAIIEPWEAANVPVTGSNDL